MIPFQSGQPLKASDLNANFAESKLRSFVPGNGQLGQFGGNGWIAKRSAATATTGGGSDIVSFTLTDADCLFGTATGTVTRIPCGASSPAIGSSIDLLDDDGCYLIGDNDMMVGRKGKAVRMEEVETDDPYSPGCKWCIISLCCGSISC